MFLLLISLLFPHHITFPNVQKLLLRYFLCYMIFSIMFSKTSVFKLCLTFPTFDIKVILWSLLPSKFTSTPTQCLPFCLNFPLARECVSFFSRQIYPIRDTLYHNLYKLVSSHLYTSKTSNLPPFRCWRLFSSFAVRERSRRMDFNKGSNWRVPSADELLAIQHGFGYLVFK